MIPNRNLYSDLRQRIKEEPKERVKRDLYVPPKSKRKSSGSPYYDAFLNKCEDLEKNMELFKTRDLVYYFRYIAEQEGYKYVVANIKKDMAIFKRLQDNFSPVEICGMIEFLYQSEQDYLDKERLSPNLLSSSWINTIYSDMNLWIEDKYIPNSQKKATKNKKREWSEPKDQSIAKIGEWD